MYIPLLRRHKRPIIRILLFLFLTLTTLETLHVQNLLRSSTGTGTGTAPHSSSFEPGTQRIFIAAILWNSEAILRSALSAAILDLATTLGPQNVFVSIYEGGSWDGTKDALRELDGKLEHLGVERWIGMSNVTHAESVEGVGEGGKGKGEGWVKTPKGEVELRRIPYLAAQRNVGLRPLVEMAGRGVRFDKVLFVNDVVFETPDVLRLLGTRNGHYAAACSLDFKTPPAFYDTFALRDARGNEHLMPRWPYFRAHESRNAILRNAPVPVTSCWNGIVAMPAAPFTSTSTSSPPLRFRGIPDSLAASHLEASECCLVHADNPLSAADGVWVNPSVRVGYTRAAYDAVNALTGVHAPERFSAFTVFLRLWENRVRRWGSTTVIKVGVVRGRVERWRGGGGKGKGKGNVEPGGFCLINEMQVLRKIGWAHV